MVADFYGVCPHRRRRLQGQDTAFLVTRDMEGLGGPHEDKWDSVLVHHHGAFDNVRVPPQTFWVKWRGSKWPCTSQQRTNGLGGGTVVE